MEKAMVANSIASITVNSKSGSLRGPAWVSRVVKTRFLSFFQ
jgi:hypothetical protein